MMATDDFAEHVARVRARFAAKLNDKIAESFAELDKMSAGNADSVETVIIAHRRLHEMYGIAPTLGFAATGQAAGAARTVVRDAAKSKRALRPEEIAALKSELERLREAATADLREFSSEMASDAS
jgi:uncharacterized protein YbjQ (UPF0145 family)